MGMLHRSGSRRETATAYGLVAAQFTLLLVVVLWSPPRRWELPDWLDRGAGLLGLAGAFWLVAGIAGLGRSVSALPLPVVHGTLKIGGLYRLSRHPIYTGVLALAWSAAIRSGSPWPLLVALALTAVLHIKARFEEKTLRRAYPGYADYASRTPRFLPLGRMARPRHR